MEYEIYKILTAPDEYPARWEPINDEISFFKTFFHPDRLPKLDIIDGYERHGSMINGASRKEWRKDEEPLCLKGIYLLFASDGSLLYVGVTAKSYFHRLERHQNKFEWRFADFIPFEENLWIAHALESFLIDSLRPYFNVKITAV